MSSTRSDQGWIGATRRDRVNSIGSVKVKVSRRDKVSSAREVLFQSEAYQMILGYFHPNKG